MSQVFITQYLAELDRLRKVSGSGRETIVREMLIQHVLTEEIFAKVFDDSDFHRKNNVAHELYVLEETFFTGGLKRDTQNGGRDLSVETVRIVGEIEGDAR